MTMKYGSVCSGIEAASVAWHHLGWKAQWFSEIEHFPSEVLKYRFPTVENLGDMTKLTTNETFKASTIDLLVGGTPCQSFSVAGLRGGLADPRGNLMLTFLSLADSKKPRWIVWENVPGVLSSNGGKDFGTFLGALGELGYGFAYRVLDAQHFGVAQRRRRVFVVGYLGDWRVAAAVLFERESLQRDIKPSRKKREEVTPDAERSLGEAGDAEPIAFDTFNQTTSNVNQTIKSPQGGVNESIGVVAQPIAIAENTIGRQPMNGGNGDGFTEDGPMYTLNATGVHGVAQPFRKVRRAQSDSDFETWEKDETANTLNCFDVGDVRSTNVVAQPIAYSFDALSSNSMKSSNPHSGCRQVDVAKTLDTTTPEPSKNQGGIAIAQPLYYESHPNDSRVNGPKDVADTVSARYGTGGGNTPLVQQPFRKVRRAQTDSDFETWEKDETANTINCFDVGDVRSTNVVAQPIAFQQNTRDEVRYINGNGSIVGALSASSGMKQTNYLAQPIAFKVRGGCEGGGKGYLGQEEQAFTISATQDQQIAQPIAVDWRTAQVDQGIAQTLKTDLAKMSGPCIAVDVYNQSIDGQTSATITEAVGGTYTSGPKVMHLMAIRRLTPKECERLQGFPDDWTRIPYRNKPADQCPDGPRYKACGNSMAVPVMRWIGQRIQYVESLMKES